MLQRSLLFLISFFLFTNSAHATMANQQQEAINLAQEVIAPYYFTDTTQKAMIISALATGICFLIKQGMKHYQAAKIMKNILTTVFIKAPLSIVKNSTQVIITLIMFTLLYNTTRGDLLEPCNIAYTLCIQKLLQENMFQTNSYKYDEKKADCMMKELDCKKDMETLLQYEVFIATILPQLIYVFNRRKAFVSSKATIQEFFNMYTINGRWIGGGALLFFITMFQIHGLIQA